MNEHDRDIYNQALKNILAWIDKEKEQCYNGFNSTMMQSGAARHIALMDLEQAVKEEMK